MKIYIDRAAGQERFYFIKTPVWFSVEVDVPKELVDATELLTERFNTVTAFLGSVYERRRAGVEGEVEVPDNIKEIIEACLVPAEARRAKKQKPQGSAVDSSTPSPEA